MDNLVLTSIPLEVIDSRIAETVKKELQTFLAHLSIPSTQNEYLTRKEAASLLSISLPTLHEWTKEGKVVGYRIASRVRYKRTDLEQALQQIRTPRRAA